MALDPITGIAELGGKIIDKLFPNKDQANQYKLQLAQMQIDGELKQLDGYYKIYQLDSQNSDKFISRARPAFLYVMYILILLAPIIGITYAINQTFTSQVITGMRLFLSAIPGELYSLFGFGYGSYNIARSIDKKTLANTLGR